MPHVAPNSETKLTYKISFAQAELLYVTYLIEIHCIECIMFGYLCVGVLRNRFANTDEGHHRIELNIGLIIWTLQ